MMICQPRGGESVEDVPYGRILREGWLIILIATFLGGAIGYGMTKPMPRTYAATSTLLLQVESSQTSLFERNQFSQARIKSYPALVDSPEVVTGVRADLDLDPAVYSDREIRSMLSADNTADTVLMDVRALAPTSEMAANMANSAAGHLSTLIEATENVGSDERYRVNLEQALPAVPPQSAVSPQVIPIVGLGLITGLATGTLIALYRTTTNRRILSIADVRRVSNLPVVGYVPRLPKRRAARARLKGASALAYAETVSNVLTLTGTAERTLVLVPLGEFTADNLTGLRDAYRQAGRSAHILDTRQNQFPLGQFHSLGDLIRVTKSDRTAAIHASGDGSIEASAAPHSDPPLTSDFDWGIHHHIYTTSDVSVARLEKALPTLARYFDGPNDLTVIIVDPQSTTLLAAVAAPLVIGVRSHATNVADLISLSVKLQIMGIRPLGVLMTSARTRLRTAVAQSWNQLEFYPTHRSSDPRSGS